MKSYILILIMLWALHSKAQVLTSEKFVPIAAGREYKKSAIGQLFWGNNWRNEWIATINAPIVLLDTLYGGLIPYQVSGGGESKSLRLKSKEGKEYTLRSINKTRGKTLPWLLKRGPYRKRVQDGVSMSHPYAAFALPIMLENAKIYHAKPKLLYLPRQETLDSLNKIFEDDLYLLEERAVGDWSDANHLGNFIKFITTRELMDSMKKNNDIEVDQYAFIKARLFDVIIGDVDRHEGNWNWGVKDTALMEYSPVPNDRDQAFFKHDGLLTKVSLALTRIRWMQSFNYKIRNVATFTNTDASFDQFFTNEMDHEDWISAAGELQKSLTDSVIELSINQMPAEIVKLSGNELIRKLKFRRDHLQAHAAKYFRSTAKRVQLNGTTKKEHFVAKRLSSTGILMSIYREDGNGVRELNPYYQRNFNAKETKRITIESFGGGDSFEWSVKVKGLKIIIK